MHAECQGPRVDYDDCQSFAIHNRSQRKDSVLCHHRGMKPVCDWGFGRYSRGHYDSLLTDRFCVHPPDGAIQKLEGFAISLSAALFFDLVVSSTMTKMIHVADWVVEQSLCREGIENRTEMSLWHSFHMFFVVTVVPFSEQNPFFDVR